MSKTIKIFLIALLCINIFVAQAGAWPFSWPIFKPAQPTQDSQAIKDNKFYSMYAESLLPLNTPVNVYALSIQMDNYGLTEAKVHVIDLNHDLFILKGSGLSPSPHTANYQVFSLTSGQIKEIASMMTDGQLSYYEKFKIYTMLKGY